MIFLDHRLSLTNKIDENEKNKKKIHGKIQGNRCY
jgi:hypothetical protein